MTTPEKIQKGVDMIKENGWVFENEEKWILKFSLSWIIWNFWYYKLPNDELTTLHIEIVDKPFLVPESIIDKKIKDFFN